MRLAPLLVLGFVSAASADWTPPAEPDPQKILDEAAADTRAGRYDDALAKHVWFHEHALEHQPAQAGVRLSFALMYWKELGERHPPALAKLKEFRDAARFDVENGDDVRNSFHDLASINRTLDEERLTVETFESLDARDPQAARAVFDVARPALVKAKRYELAGKYVDPKTFERSEEALRLNLRLAAKPEHGDSLREFGRKHFTNETATLISLLVVNDRKAEAEAVAAKAREAWDDAAFRKAIDSALEGNVPAPWP